ncbi:hypothetical protein DEU56DRAFT_736436 [Suillus clintonianus]|uniref:uncharacterized protein n=1 Tax=Suillus clintonianus TaxID=1904413 RepID=UPI001B87622F|nr:uncharacterized protein DEU56DRAFT_736436 [Suillus clintonianus]KAG2138344.1 hypothetical protein DEU56DRAFT_736436 [Suillus clintonianus]
MESELRTNIVTVYPDIKYQDVSTGPLQSVLLTICFSGRLPRQVIERNIPVQIAVSFSEEYGIFASPVVEAALMDLCSSTGDSMHSDCASACSHGHDESPALPDDILIPFLPLQHFNYSDQAKWALLMKDIEGWLVSQVNCQTQLWTWGRDAFWLAFIAAYPSFPRGLWPKWDCRIPLEGTFIEQWLERSGDVPLTEDQDVMNVLADIWAEFGKHAALFFPDPLVASD